jgi:hypothetical protein
MSTARKAGWGCRARSCEIDANIPEETAPVERSRETQNLHPSTLATIMENTP